MKKIKEYKIGFTLAETLIILAIIGIIAALVIPSLISYTASKLNVGSVSKAKELFEQAAVNIIQTANKNSTGIGANNLAAIQIKDLVTGSNDETFVLGGESNTNNLITKTMALTGITTVNYNSENIRTFDGSALLSTIYSDIADYPTYKLDKSDTVVIYRPITDTIPNDITNDRVLTTVLIDANGNKTPNRVGKDVFVFGLANDGHLVPAGSSAYNNNIMSSETRDVYPNACTDGDIGDGISCAARVIADGWEIKYIKNKK